MRNELDDEHIPGYPSGWVAIRFIQLFFVISIWLALSVQLLGRPLFGLTSFSLAAAWAGPIFAADTVRRSLRSSYGFCDNYKVFGGVVAGIACLGAVEFPLFFIAWVTDAVVIYRHRRSGGRARARRVAAAGSGTAPD